MGRAEYRAGLDTQASGGPHMSLGASITRSLQADMRAELRALERAVADRHARCRPRSQDRAAPAGSKRRASASGSPDTIAQRVAEAAKEGSFLGFGGVQVSDAEKATLAEISGALKLTA